MKKLLPVSISCYKFNVPGRALSFIIIFLFTACTKIMHKEEISIGKIESYDQLLEAVDGVYGRMQRLFTVTNAFAMYESNVKADDLSYPKGGDYNIFTSQGYCLKYPDKQYILLSDGGWSSLYKVIGSVNNILVQYDLKKTKDIATRQLLGELYLIRAYCYFRLTRCFGQIPLIDDINVSYSKSKPPFTKIYQFIEDDLNTATTLLPSNNASARIPYITPNRGTAKAILAEVYLSWAGYPVKDATKYALAAREAGEVIDSSGYFGFALLDDFAWLWDRAHLYNSESVFSLYCDNTKPPKYNILSSWEGFYYGGSFYNGLQWTSIVPGKSIHTSFYSSGVRFYNNYPPEYRKEITFYTTLYWNYQSDSAGISVPRNSVYKHIDTITSCSRIAYRKFYYDPEIIPDSILSISYGDENYLGIPRVYIFRYAQTLLTYAEAMARSGQLNARAYEYVNEIRRRAHHLDLYSPSAYDLQSGLSPEAFADSVVQERGWEMAGEPEGRWFDLLRLEKVKDMPNLLDPGEQQYPDNPVTEKDYFISPPQGDIDLNPNLGNN